LLFFCTYGQISPTDTQEVATQDIEEDELLFRIPRSSILCVENSILANEVPKATFEYLGPWLSLILVMLYEYQNGSASNWAPYFSVLPTEFNTLMFWEEDELDELQASAVREKIGKSSADDMFRNQLVPIIREIAPLFFSGDDKASERAEQMASPQGLELMHKMGTLIMAYAFDIEPTNQHRDVDEEGYASEDEDEALPKGMVPLADMLNANADRNNARLFYEKDSLCMKALKCITAGEEIFNDYGPLPRSDLLRRYGYITDNYTRYDVAEIPFELVTTYVQHFGAIQPLDDRLQYLDDQDMIETGYDIAHSAPFTFQESISPELIMVVQTLLLPSPEFERLKSKGKLPKPGKLTTTDAECLRSIVTARARQYPTSLEDDLRGSVTMSAASNKEQRKAMAKAVRIGEKAILRAAEEALTTFVQESGGMEGVEKRTADGSPEASSKRQRMR
jgi:SET domain-containing protein 6